MSRKNRECRSRLSGMTSHPACPGAYSLGAIISGHTLKHLVAAGGVACLVGMLRARAQLVGRPVRPHSALQPTAPLST